MSYRAHERLDWVLAWVTALVGLLILLGTPDERYRLWRGLAFLTLSLVFVHVARRWRWLRLTYGNNRVEDP